MTDSLIDNPRLDGLAPASLRPQSHKIMLEDFDLMVDIGFHDFEIGTPQRLRVNIEVWLEPAHFPRCDTVDAAWNYDFLRSSVLTLAASQRFNLQETVAHAIYDLLAARDGVKALRISTRKPDIYPDCAAVGVEISSF